MKPSNATIKAANKPATKKVRRSVVERVNSGSCMRLFRRTITEALRFCLLWGILARLRRYASEFGRSRCEPLRALRAFRVSQPKGPWDGAFEHGEFANMGSPSKARVGWLAFAQPYLSNLVRPRRLLHCHRA